MPSRRASTARLSPTHAVVSCTPRSTLAVRVVPESVQSTLLPATRCVLVAAKASQRRPRTSRSSAPTDASSRASVLAAELATRCPARAPAAFVPASTGLHTHSAHHFRRSLPRTGLAVAVEDAEERLLAEGKLRHDDDHVLVALVAARLLADARCAPDATNHRAVHLRGAARVACWTMGPRRHGRAARSAYTNAANRARHAATARVTTYAHGALASSAVHVRRRSMVARTAPLPRCLA